MTRAHSFRIVSVLVLATAPAFWLACGGGDQKPAESAADESKESSNSGSGSEAPASSAEAEKPAEAASAAPAEKPEPAATASAAPAEAAPPPSPTFGSTDCGSCVDKACAKPAAACGKESDCQSYVDSIHSCTSGGATCLSSATAPTAAKPKKLAGAYGACVKKALASKACKPKCQ